MSDKQEGAQGFDDRELAGAEKDETSLPKPQIEIIDFDAVEKKPYTSPLLDSISGVLGDGIQLAI